MTALLASLSAAMRDAEARADWTCSRCILEPALERAGIVPDKIVKGANKTVSLVGHYAVKACSVQQVDQTLRLVDRLGIYAAEVFDHGRVWIIQERVEPVRSPDFARDMAKRFEAYDITNNTGARHDGTLAAFDGFCRPQTG